MGYGSCHGNMVRVWELVWGVRGPPVGADKDGGRTIWVVWFPSNSLSAAEMPLPFFYKFPFAFEDKFFILSCLWRQKGRTLPSCNKPVLLKVIRGTC